MGQTVQLIIWVVLAKCLWFASIVTSRASGQSLTKEVVPEFLAALENHTVTQGRDIHFTCVVNHLGPYKVAWIKSDSKAILAIHTHLVAHNSRLSVSHNGHNAWKLMVSNVQKNDSGTYMCQINTDPMRSQMGNLEVVIPPDIMNEEGPDDHVAVEGGSLRVRCKATGIPEPSVLWRRENSTQIVLRQEGREKQLVQKYDGETLMLTNVHRSDMGIYLCIASNGIPPTVSKRFLVQVQFHPTTKVVNQLVAAPIGSDVIIQCQVETWPKAMHSWYRDSTPGTDEKLMPSVKYSIEEIPINSYTVLLNLTIRNLEKRDFGEYNCSSVNAIGKSEGLVRLQELHIAPKTTVTPISHYNENHKPRKKIEKTGTFIKEKHPRRRKKQRVDDETGNEEEMDDVLTTLEVKTVPPPVGFTSVAPPWIFPRKEKSSAHQSAKCLPVIIICLLMLLQRTN